jgi:hypothetical protein
MFEARHRRAQLQTLIKSWIEFRELVHSHLGDDAVSQVKERRFLELKGDIAEGLTRVADTFPATHLREVVLQQRGIVDFMNQYTSLRNGHNQSQEQQDAFEKSWQRFYLSLSQFKGVTNVRPRDNRGMAPIPSHWRGNRMRMQRFMNHWFVKFVLITAVLVIAVWAVSAVLPWEKMGLSAGVSTGVRGAAGDASSFLRSQAGSLDNNLNPTFSSVRGFFRPVINQWGPEATVILSTLLLLLLGYWVFIRTK